ncbi:MAG: hypothetical protein SFY70_07765 [Bacteroidia bacterium]|nr:hypothetical protein [Bacteroidia bacterium]
MQTPDPYSNPATRKPVPTQTAAPLAGHLAERCLRLQQQNQELLAEVGELGQVVRQQRYLRLNLYRTILALSERLSAYDDAFETAQNRYAELLHHEKVNLILEYGTDRPEELPESA